MYHGRTGEATSRWTDAKFTHGICPECAEKMYGDYFRKERGEQ